MTARTLLGAATIAVSSALCAATHTDLKYINFNVSKAAPGAMKLHLMTDAVADGAVCLDGTAAGYYFSPAATNAANASWQLYFQGGGWCYDEMDCWGRSKGNLGSSKGWAPTSSMGGIMSADCTANPDYCNFNRVHMAYCDGNSFSGNRDEAVTVKGDKLYFRGRRIIDATIKSLTQLHGFANAETVLLTGCSAGGLATYLHTDYVKTLMPAGVTKYKASAISGFFLLHNTVEDKPVYPTEMKYIFNLANSTHGVNDKCIAAQKAGEEWKCNFAQEAYAYTESETFPLNSALDSWQTGCIYTSELAPLFPQQTGTENGVCSAAPGWKDCAGNPESCSADQMVTMNKYITDFSQIASSTATYKKPGNGAFFHSCHTHCEAQSGDWNKFTVNGLTMQQANSRWWNSDGSDPAAKHTYSPCQYKTGAKGPRKCNPTC